jgi:putative acetyltransferase
MEQSGLTLGVESPLQDDVQKLFAIGDRYYDVLYPAESNHLVTAAELLAANADFVVLRQSGILCGCGAVVDAIGYGEVKRLYVSDGARGKGVGRQIMNLLIDRARTRGLGLLRLEVGIRQPEAISLYRALGFRDVKPFGNYQSDPLSLFMELNIGK